MSAHADSDGIAVPDVFPAEWIESNGVAPAYQGLNANERWRLRVGLLTQARDALEEVLATMSDDEKSEPWVEGSRTPEEDRFGGIIMWLQLRGADPRPPELR